MNEAASLEARVSQAEHSATIPICRAELKRKNFVRNATADLQRIILFMILVKLSKLCKGLKEFPNHGLNRGRQPFRQ